MFVFNRQATADSADRSVFGKFWFEPLGMKSASGMRITSRSAMQLSAVYTCVKILSETFAVLPFKLYQRQGPRNRTLLQDHWLYQLLAIRPNRYQTPFEWKEMMMGHLALRGNAFNEIFANGRGEITELMPLHPDRVKIELLVNGSYRYRVTDAEGNERTLGRGDVWHIRGLSSDGIIGLSPIEQAREIMGLGLSMQNFASRYFYNNARPGGWIEMPVNQKFKDDTELDKFKTNWKKSYGGSNTGSTAILENGLKYHELKISNDDSQFVETYTKNRAEIAGLFGVPAHRINELDRATFSNIEQQSLDFVVGTMTPIAERFESSITTFLMPEGEGMECEFDFANLLRGDMAARGVYYTKMFNVGALSPNDIRDREGEAPTPGGDIYMVPMNMVSLANAGKTQSKRAARPAPAPAAEPQDDDSQARLQALLQANAARMARRVAAGQPPTADVLAEALSIPVPSAQAWLALDKAGRSQPELAASLVELAIPQQKGQS